MIARLGRVVCWACYGLAAILAAGALAIHGYPLVGRPPPAASEADKASIKIVSQSPDKIVYVAALPSGRVYDMEQRLSQDGSNPSAANLDRIKRNVSKMVQMNAPRERIHEYIASEGTTVEQVRNHVVGASQPEEVARDALRRSLKLEQEQRAASWDAFSQILPFAFAGAFLIALFGRAVRYVLSNE